ncbi:hypothetical protein OVY48_21865 [Sphingobium sp. SA2]|uniref:hypothetical protein n=1 Tax=Sphingobium sp. SA2 TaxID=1524832 RepID=UPI0028C10C03|nr:hypothetical protein [Sphingobium sp. SA2]MDT7536049.1 hypothetical protein [Sphingobium sp. SA2]
MNALFLKVEKGFSAGPVGCGYRTVRRLSSEGEMVRGECQIEPSEAPVVERIFREFAAMEQHDRNRQALPGRGYSQH